MKYLAILFLSVFLFSCSQKKEDIFQLQNQEGNQIDILNQTNSATITKAFGKPLSIEKEPEPEAEGLPTSTIITYRGLKLELTGNSIDEITIKNNDWHIGDITIGTDARFIEENYKFLKKKGDYLLYLIPDFDGVLFIKLDSENKIAEYGLSNPS
nr:hypothetical protein [uncultured Flavobacterium sp.]